MTSSDSQPRPIGLRQAFPALPDLIGFNVFNAISFNIILGAPMILLVQRWGAPSSYIGALTALVPLLMISQLYMAPRVEYIGFRRVLVAGWTGRTFVLMIAAILPFLSGWLQRGILLALIFFLMVLYNTLRGIATTSYMPWLHALIDAEWRGRYISIEQTVANLCAALTFFGCGWALGNAPPDARFGWLFMVSVGAAWMSILFLRRIESPPPREGWPEVEPFHVWARRIWRVRPFRRLIQCSVWFAIALSAWMPFTIVFLRDRMHVAEGLVMMMSGFNTLGVVCSAWLWGLLADRFGSRPVMSLATRVLLVMLICWLLFAVGLLPSSPMLLTACYSLYGIGFVGFHLANMRHGLNNAPRESTVMALSLFMIFTSFSNGIAPIIWGGALDALDFLHLRRGALFLDRFGVFYGVSIGLLLIAKWSIRRLPDDRAAEPHVVLYHMINDYPLRPLYALYGLLTRSGKDTLDQDPPSEPR